MGNLSCIFEYTLNLSNDESKRTECDEKIEYMNQNQTTTNLATKNMFELLNSFFNNIMQLNLGQGDIDSVLKMRAKLVTNIKIFC